MADEDVVYSSSIKYTGIFSFGEFYKFCYDWLTEQTGLDISEDEYSEKLKGDSKDLEIKWKGDKKFTDYFKFKIKMSYRIVGLKQVELTEGGVKTKTNQGQVKVSLKGILVRDYQARFEGSAWRKVMRESYERWIIQSRIKALETKIIKDCDEFLEQAKSFLDLEGKK